MIRGGWKREHSKRRIKRDFEIFTQFKLNNKANIRVTILALAFH